MLLVLSPWLAAQAPAAPKLTFEVASVKPSQPGGRGRSNVPLTEGDRFTPTGGLFTATGQVLTNYIAFAYTLDHTPDSQLNTLPEWAKTTRYDIEARAAGPATKDEFRAMMRSLLAQRFQLAAHYEVRNVPVYEMTLVKPGKLGAGLRPHVDDPPCPVPPPPAGRGGGAATPDGFPVACGDDTMLPGAPAGRWRLGARNITIETFTTSMAGGLDRPIVDHTGLSGRFDYVLEYVPDVSTDGPSVANFVQDPTGPKFWTALTEQLGVRLKPAKADVNLLIFDHIEKPTAN